MYSHFWWNNIWQQFQTNLYLGKLFSLPFTFLPSGTVDGDIWKPGQYSWTSCPRPLCCFTCPLSLFLSSFFLLSPLACSLPSFLLTSSLLPSPLHLSSFLSFQPFLPSYLFWWWAARYRKKHETIGNPYSSITRSYKWWTKNRLFPKNAFLCLQDAADFYILWYLLLFLRYI